MQSKRRRLGQHFLYDETILTKMIGLADIRPNDTVLEIGAGEGSLTRKLCWTGAKIVSFEVDDRLFSKLKESLSGFSNLELLNADALESNPKFDVLVANLPYSRSEDFIEWLATKRFRRAVVMLQTDFVDKLLSLQGRNYRAVSVIAQHVFSIRKAAEIPKNLFRPPPKVSSHISVMERTGNSLTANDLKLIKYLWSFRGKTVLSAIKIIAKKRGVSLKTVLSLLPKALLELRISDLSPSDAFRVVEVFG